MAGGIQQALLSPEMMSPQAMAGGADGFGDFGGMLASIFAPDQPTQFADAGSDPFGGGDFGGGFGDFGSGLASLFG